MTASKKSATCCPASTTYWSTSTTCSSVSTRRLQVEYGALEQEHALLRRAHDGLAAEHAILRDQFDGLQQDYDLLTGEFDWFRSEAIVPPYICTSGRNVQIAFRRTDQSVEHWEVPFESLERSIERGTDSRDNLFFELGAMRKLHNTGTGEDYYVWDFGAFVDPEPFVDVMYDLYTELGDDDAFVREAWHIVAQLMTYSEEIEETPRFPLETFLAGGGDCEDTAILLASMIKAAPVNWMVELVYMDIDNPDDPQDVNHVIVHFDTGKQYLIETTADEDYGAVRRRDRLVPRGGVSRNCRVRQTGEQGGAVAENQRLIGELLEHYGTWFRDEEALGAGRMTADLHPYERLFSPIQVNRCSSRTAS